MDHVRPQANVLRERLLGPRQFLQVLAGPRQVGKSTLLRQVLGELALPWHSASADAPEAQSSTWIRQQWDLARVLAQAAPKRGAVLAIDEIQKVPRWSDTVKALWDEDTRHRRKIQVVLLGSSPLLMQAGLDESLAGRFELIGMQQWPFAEMKQAFHFDLEAYVFFGGYPGAATLTKNLPRWRAYVRDALIETSISRDVMQMTRIDKPALLRRLFDLGCAYSSQELSFNKMLGQLQDAGNTVTLSAYGELLSSAGLLTPLQKYAGQKVRQRASSPKWLVHDTAFITAPLGITPREARRDPAVWGRVVESAVGAHLLHGARNEGYELFYFREGDAEVDFVVRRGKRVTGIEVKSGHPRAGRHAGMATFEQMYGPDRVLLVGDGGLDLETFLSADPAKWVA